MQLPPAEATFIPAHLPPYLDALRTLFRSYREEVDTGSCFQGFEEELAALPGVYAPPQGVLMLVEWEGAPAACAALRPLEAGVCELKRLYVAPDYRGRGLGRLLVERFMERARVLGYHEMRLETLPSMKAAITLYRDLGFTEHRTGNTSHAPDHLAMGLVLQGNDLSK